MLAFCAPTCNCQVSPSAERGRTRTITKTQWRRVKGSCDANSLVMTPPQIKSGAENCANLSEGQYNAGETLVTPQVVDRRGIANRCDMSILYPRAGIYCAEQGVLRVGSPTKPNIVSFGGSEYIPHSRELRKEGMRAGLDGQPLAILELLLERPGELVTREELQKRLWPEDTFVDFEHSLNSAVKRLRAALNDSADQPRYIETLARRGYRLVAPVGGTVAERESEKAVLIPPESQAQA